MTANELAALLNGRQYCEEISKQEILAAEQDKLVVAFGQSDDLIEFRGAIYDELGAYDGTKITVVNGKVVNTDDWEEDKETLNKYSVPLPKEFIVNIQWCPESLNCSWLVISENFPSSPFDIFEDEEIYCRGIVFSLDDLR